MTGSSRMPSSWYSTLVDNMPVAFLRTTVEGQIVYCNKAAAELFGFSCRSDFAALPITSWYQNIRDRGAFIQHLSEREILREFIVGFKKRNGTPFWCSTTAQVVKDGDGTIEYIDAVCRDITAELAPNSSLFQPAEVDSSGTNFVVTIDGEGTILSLTNSENMLFDHPQGEVIGRKLTDLLTPKCRAIFPQILNRVEQCGKSKGIFTMVDKSGGFHHLEFYAIAASNAGRGAVMEIVARDVTEMILLQRAQADRLKFQGVMEMSGAVAHRLNQPLTVISNVLGDLEKDLALNGQVQEKFLCLKTHICTLGELLRKISKINRYVPMNYVGGIKIVDIDKSSTLLNGTGDDQENPSG
jgi:PAS domain S-box-containing protein